MTQIYSAVGATPDTALHIVNNYVTAGGGNFVVWAPLADPLPAGAVATWEEAVTAIQALDASETSLYILGDPVTDTIHIPGGVWALKNTTLVGRATAADDSDFYRAYQYTLTVICDGTAALPTRINGCVGLKNIFFRGNNEDTSVTLTESFTQPGSGDTVTINVSGTIGVTVGEMCFISDGGYYFVISVDGLSLVIQNLNYPGNASPSSTIGSGNWILPDNAVFHTNTTAGVDSYFTLDNCDFRSNGNYFFGSFHIGPYGGLYLQMNGACSARWYSFQVDGWLVVQTNGPCWLGNYVFNGQGDATVFLQPGAYMHSNNAIGSITVYQGFVWYVPGTPGNWSGSPANLPMSTALDRLAAALVAAGHTP